MSRAVRLDESALTHGYAEVGGLRLHYVEAGSGPLVVLLHGFPGHWWTWRHQIPALAAAGLRVVAPDLRGFNLSDRPRGAVAYAPEVLAHDVSALIAALGAREAVVVGHDVGATIAWTFAMRHPDQLARLIVMNGPHPAAIRPGMTSFGQLPRAWYTLGFQLALVPEALLAAFDLMTLRTLARAACVHGSLSEDDVDRTVAPFAAPGALGAALDLFRAVRSSVLRRAGEPARVEAPVLVVWGERDSWLGPAFAGCRPEWAANLQLERIHNAGHAVQIDAPERVNTLLVGFARDVESFALAADR